MDFRSHGQHRTTSHYQLSPVTFRCYAGDENGKHRMRCLNLLEYPGFRAGLEDNTLTPGTGLERTMAYWNRMTQVRFPGSGAYHHVQGPGVLQAGCAAEIDPA